MDDDDDKNCNSIDKDTILFRIPYPSFISKQRAMDLCPWLEQLEKEVNKNNDDNDDDDDDDESIKFHNSFTDIVLAIAMASQSPDKLLYLQTLPQSSSFDALPWRWSDSDIDALLGGTSISERVKVKKVSLKEDYNKLKKFFFRWIRPKTDQSQQEPNEIPISFPSYDKFNDMFAAVSSRAFQISEQQDDIALVPILDLCNHCRGKSNLKKNVSYEIVYENVGSDKSSSSSSTSSDVPIMVVKASATISEGGNLRLTYGALGNGQLLMNYGFCIPQNYEPDGSSNDIVDFKTNISLRTGPKAYCYGPFVMAIETFYETRSLTNDDTVESDQQDEESKGENQEEEDDDNDFDSFLNEDTNGDQNDFDDIYGDQTNTGQEVATDSDDITAEIISLMKFRHELIQRSKKYIMCSAEIQAALSSGKPSPRFYSSILCQSELRTIYFFIRATEKVLNILNVRGKIRSTSC